MDWILVPVTNSNTFPVT